jgi:hypothetical protein
MKPLLGRVPWGLADNARPADGLTRPQSCAVDAESVKDGTGRSESRPAS